MCSYLSTSSVVAKAPFVADFSGVTFENTVPFVPPITEGKVIKIYDGDTITIAAKLPYPQSPMYRISVRLNGIDTPEIKGQTQKEKDLAKHIRDALKVKIMDKIITLKNTSSEKYGRLLADVYLDDICINDWLIEQGFAVRYSGGTKERPDEWIQ
jgi:endonuclease YncB( thermonuclease family)